MSFETKLALFVFTLIAAFFIGRLSITKSRQYIGDQWALKRNAETYLSKVGSTSMYGDRTSISYNIKSFDGGKSWWSVEYDDDRKIVSIQPADPKLVAHYDAMVKLGKYAKEHGPINSGDAEGIQILEDVGFTVETSPIK